jgi:hypothetical protein
VLVPDHTEYRRPDSGKSKIFFHFPTATAKAAKGNYQREEGEETQRRNTEHRHLSRAFEMRAAEEDVIVVCGISNPYQAVAGQIEVGDAIHVRYVGLIGGDDVHRFACVGTHCVIGFLCGLVWIPTDGNGSVFANDRVRWNKKVE